MSTKTPNHDKLVAAALHRLEIEYKNSAFDPNNLNSKPTIKQQQILDDFGKYTQYWIRAGNQSGKSQTCARLLTWVLTDTHPTWKKPLSWNDEPLLGIVTGRTGKQIEESLMPKIRSYLPPDSYKEVRVGNMIQRLELTNGNRIVFQSLENPNTAQERLQSYVAHITWCDELPPTMGIVRELLIRTQAKDGYNLFSFTPTIIQTEIQKFVDNLKSPEGMVYRFHMLDNPLYNDPARKEQLLARYAHLPETERDVIFRGEWSASEDRVYYFDYNTMFATPNGYSRFWRHVESVDPASSSALGLTIWAEDPETQVWYNILAEYIKGVYVPTEIIKAVQRYTEHLNIVRRISDSHESWFIHQAAAMGISYVGVYKKTNRKVELIKGLQEKLGNACLLTAESVRLIDEIQECRWSDKAEGKIVAASKYHLLDSAQYFVDNIPKPEKKLPIMKSQTGWLLEQNAIRLKQEERKATMKFSKWKPSRKGRIWNVGR